MIGRVKVIGLMSGTSADGVDAALVEWPEPPASKPFRLLGYRETPFSPELQERIHRLAAGRVPASEALAELAGLDVALGEHFASAAVELAAGLGLPLGSVDAIASHGQTVAHHPERRATLQIGDPSVIAERTGRTTVADFRPRDVAAGGEGAPLTPFFHHAALSHPREGRVVLNLGGIANITWIRRNARAEDVIAFDVGPANSLIDGVVATVSGGAERSDRDGVRARRGSVVGDLLERLLDDEFLRRGPPKSTGRERYGLAQAERLAEQWIGPRCSADDLVATLVAFSAEAVVRATQAYLDGSPIDRVLVGGGGARNPELMRALARRFAGIPVEAFDAVGVPAEAAEAMAFSLMGRNALLGLPNHLPRCTGAREETVLGEIVPGGPGLRIRA
jgi:anhydro-N-acetylmuramic acid kinase